jgi:hypothetical protein
MEHQPAWLYKNRQNLNAANTFALLLSCFLPVPQLLEKKQKTRWLFKLYQYLDFASAAMGIAASVVLLASCFMPVSLQLQQKK